MPSPFPSAGRAWPKPPAIFHWPSAVSAATSAPNARCTSFAPSWRNRRPSASWSVPCLISSFDRRRSARCAGGRDVSPSESPSESVSPPRAAAPPPPPPPPRVLGLDDDDDDDARFPDFARSDRLAARRFSARFAPLAKTSVMDASTGSVTRASAFRFSSGGACSRRMLGCRSLIHWAASFRTRSTSASTSSLAWDSSKARLSRSQTLTRASCAPAFVRLRTPSCTLNTPPRPPLAVTSGETS